MKSKPFALVLGAVVLIVLSAACGKPAETPQPAAEAPPVAEAPAPPAEPAPAPAADALPETLPADLTTAPALNGFAVDLMLKNVPPNVFSSTTATEEEKAKARQALKLAVEAYDKAIGLYDKNESFFYGRAQALHTQFVDTKDAALKEKALADLDKALAINPNHSPAKALKELISK
ncbi:MAG: hypothetical protein RBU36_16280 [Thermoanaerobaculia bacterium]|jgi:tetratricopeptide (TPR) repeat protein|nr:hypothetical protein [Thermoanaerobaculia bacterium]